MVIAFLLLRIVEPLGFLCPSPPVCQLCRGAEGSGVRGQGCCLGVPIAGITHTHNTHKMSIKLITIRLAVAQNQKLWLRQFK